MSGDGAIVEFDSVGLRYGTGAEVLKDLDFRLNRGGFTYLTGLPTRELDARLSALPPHSMVYYVVVNAETGEATARAIRDAGGES